MEFVPCLLVILQLVNVHSVEINYLFYFIIQRGQACSLCLQWFPEQANDTLCCFLDLRLVVFCSHSSSLPGILATYL